jgi:hypothetical protein
MTLDPRVRDELERRGPANVRDLLRDTGPGPNTSVYVPVEDAPQPRRFEVEDWLREKEQAAERLASTRHDQLLWWARIAGVAAVLGVLVGGAATFYARTQYKAEAERWSDEDALRAPAQFKIDNSVTADGWRHAVVAVTNRLPVDLQIDALEAVSPGSLYFAEQRDDDPQMKGPIASAATKSLMVNRSVPPAQGWGMSFFVKVNGTPNSDHGEQLRVRFVMRENGYPNRSLSHDETANVP